MSKELFEGINLDLLAGAEASFDNTSVTSAQSVDTEDDGDTKAPRAEAVDTSGMINIDDIADLDEPVVESKDKKDIDDKTPSEDKSVPSTPLSSLVSTLVDEGVLPSLDEEELGEIKSGADLIAIINKQIKSNEFADLTDDQKEYLTALRSGVPNQTYTQQKNIESQYSNIQDSNLEADDALELRKILIKQDFMIKGYDEATANKYSERSVNLGEDVEDSKGALKRLQEYQKNATAGLIKEAEEAKKAQETAATERLDNIKNKIKSTDEILPSMKINIKSKDKVYDLLTKAAGQDSNGNPVNAIVNSMINDQEYLIKLAYLHHITDGMTKWDKIISTAKSAAVNKLDEQLKKEEFTRQTADTHSGATGNKVNKPNKSIADDILNAFGSMI